LAEGARARNLKAKKAKQRVRREGGFRTNIEDGAGLTRTPVGPISLSYVKKRSHGGEGGKGRAAMGREMQRRPAAPQTHTGGSSKKKTKCPVVAEDSASSTRGA